MSYTLVNFMCLYHLRMFNLSNVKPNISPALFCSYCTFVLINTVRFAVTDFFLLSRIN